MTIKTSLNDTFLGEYLQEGYLKWLEDALIKDATAVGYRNYYYAYEMPELVSEIKMVEKMEGTQFLSYIFNSMEKCSIEWSKPEDSV